MAQPEARATRARTRASPGVLRLVEGFTARMDETIDRVIAAMREEIPTYARASPALLDSAREQVRLHFQALLASLAENRRITPEEMMFVRPAASDRARTGVPLEDFMHAFRIGQREIWRALAAEITDDETRDAALSVVELVVEYINVSSAHAAEVYVEVEQLQHADIERVRRDLLGELLEGRLPEPGPRLDAAREADLQPGSSLLVITAAPRAKLDDEHALRSAARAIARACGGAVAPLTVIRREEIVSMAAMQERDAGALSIALSELQAKLADHGVPLAIGVSTVQLGLDRAPLGYREARVARERVGPDGGLIALCALSAFDYLTLIGDETAWGLVSPRVREFVQQDLAEGGILSQTLLAYVDADLNAKAASERLFLHVNTAHYRLGKIAERTGCDLRRISDVLELLIAIKLTGKGAPTDRRPRPAS
jgi:PucR-like helix-turn-helix protein/diguanylate cyclase with GGDEF domain